VRPAVLIHPSEESGRSGNTEKNGTVGQELGYHPHLPPEKKREKKEGGEKVF